MPPAATLIERRAPGSPPWTTIIVGTATTLLAAILLSGWGSKESTTSHDADVAKLRYERTIAIDSVKNDIKAMRELQLDTFCALKPQDRRCVTSRP
jgi:hypothetical protein